MNHEEQLYKTDQCMCGRNSRTTNLHCPPVINSAVGGGQSPMINFLWVHVGHCPGNISSKWESEAPVEWNVLILQHIIETALGTVFTDQGNVVGLTERGTNKLAQVWMIQCPIYVYQEFTTTSNMYLHDQHMQWYYLICITSFLTVLLTTRSFLGTFLMATTRPPL